MKCKIVGNNITVILLHPILSLFYTKAILEAQIFYSYFYITYIRAKFHIAMKYASIEFHFLWKESFLPFFFAIYLSEL